MTQKVWSGSRSVLFNISKIAAEASNSVMLTLFCRDINIAFILYISAISTEDWKTERGRNAKAGKKRTRRLRAMHPVSCQSQDRNAVNTSATSPLTPCVFSDSPDYTLGAWPGKGPVRTLTIALSSRECPAYSACVKGLCCLFASLCFGPHAAGASPISRYS